ncbi:hypothetical protein [Lysobacter gummosus]|uniref:hypothetical protein n=1 Tax=Lysobacter gummosus TaxID=262324 RepID=UPI00362FC7BF
MSAVIGTVTTPPGLVVIAGTVPMPLSTSPVAVAFCKASVSSVALAPRNKPAIRPWRGPLSPSRVW